MIWPWPHIHDGNGCNPFSLGFILFFLNKIIKQINLLHNSWQTYLLFQPVLGKIVQRPALLDKKLQRDLKMLAEPDDLFPTIIGERGGIELNFSFDNSTFFS